MIDNDHIFQFKARAGKATWAGAGEALKEPERKGFNEFVYTERNLMYRDSFVGSDRSWGTEIVYLDQKPIWNMVYGGGMVDGKESLSSETYNFLKRALRADVEGFQSFRGPYSFEDGEWSYTYEQTGDTDSFHGNEQIFFNGELVHYYRTIGGRIE